jgi:hypothetical protein
VFTERADLAEALGHADDAVRFARSALRMTYTRTTPDPIATAHQRLARYLGEVGGPPEEQQGTGLPPPSCTSSAAWTAHWTISC